MLKSLNWHLIYLLMITGLVTALFILSQKQGAERISTNSLIAADAFISKTAQKTFTDATEDAAFAITERNFRITNTLRIGNAIRERGNSEFPQNDVILFCNIQYAESMLELEPDYVNYCPGQITVREVSENDVIISAPLVPLHPDNRQLNLLVNEVNKLILESVEFAAENWQSAVK